MTRLFKRINPVVSAMVIASFFAPSLIAAQGGSMVRGYFDFFDNTCYPCSGPLESNEFCTCRVNDDAAMMAVRY